jgi:flagellar biosynthesis protein FlhB
MPGDRTERATPQRREKARKDGDILHSRELSSAAGTLAGVLCFGMLRQTIIRSFRSGFNEALNLSSPRLWETNSAPTTLLVIRRLGLMTLIPISAILAATVITAALVGILQTGGLQFNANSIGIKLDRIVPASNLKNMFSLHAVSRLGKSLIPAAVVGILAAQYIAREFTIPGFSLGRLEVLGSDVYKLLATTSLLLLAWAIVDYLVEWRNRESRLMMSREEMKQEFKNTEGSPQTRGRIRSLQRQMRGHKVKADVAKATVVLTNPTHYAVALAFDFATMDPPKVLAKGRNLRAEKIKVEARWAGVPIIENPPLARSLYRSVEVGGAIPAELYAAVAGILAYLYRQRVQEESCERRASQSATNLKDISEQSLAAGPALNSGIAPARSVSSAPATSKGKEA